MRWMSFLIDATQEDGKQLVIPKPIPKGAWNLQSMICKELETNSLCLLEPEDGAQVVDQSEID